MPFLRTFLVHPNESDPASPLRKGTQRIEAATLREALSTAATLLDVTIVPHENPDWFRVYRWPGQRADYSRPVDIFVRRGDQSIYPKQDLSYPLLDSDTVCISLLAG